LLLINGLAVGVGQLPAIRLAHGSDFTVHTLSLFSRFEASQGVN
jgi:hypothetical protein